MSDSGWFVVAGAIFAVALAVGFRRWWSSGGKERGLARGVLIVATVGGFVGAPFWWFNLPASFAWDLTPLASRLLAAAAVSFGLAGLVALERGGAAVRDMMTALVAIYLLPLAAFVLFLHTDRLDFSAPIAWGFVAAAVGLGCSALFAVRTWQPARQAGVDVDTYVASIMLLAGLAIGLWGIAMLVQPAAPIRQAFPWPRDPLTARLIAAMLLTLGAALLWGRQDRQTAGIALLLAGAYGVGVVFACIPAFVYGTPFPRLYAAVFGLLAVVSVLLCARLNAVPAGTRAQT